MNRAGLPLGPARGARPRRGRAGGARRRSALGAPPRSRHGLAEVVAAAQRRSRSAIRTRPMPARYRTLVERARKAETERTPGRDGLRASRSLATATSCMAYKDEYEVARLFTDGRFRDDIASQFEGDYRIKFHLAPPLIAKRDPATGHLLKQSFGPWTMTAFRLIARLKFLRGSALDIFGMTAERRAERGLVADYERLIDELAAKLDHDNHRLAVALASLPEQIRGYGHIKDANLARAKAREAELLAAFRDPAARSHAAE